MMCCLIDLDMYCKNSIGIRYKLFYFKLFQSSKQIHFKREDEFERDQNHEVPKKHASEQKKRTNKIKNDVTRANPATKCMKKLFKKLIWGECDVIEANKKLITM